MAALYPPFPASPAMQRALDAIERECRPDVAVSIARKAANMAAGRLPTLDYQNLPIPLDGDEAQRRREAIARELQVATWETQTGEVEAIRADMGRA